MKRTAATLVTLAFVAGCSGGGLNGGGMLPGMSPNRIAAPRGIGAEAGDDGHRILDVFVTMRIPKHHRREHASIHPATISSLTRSVSFVVNGGAAQVFNATTTSPNCKAGSTGTTCTFSVKARPGSDTFVVTTYNGVSGGGTPLNRGAAVIPIVAGKANAPHITLGPVVSTTADTGIGSLRFAIGSANPNDTILFMIPSSSKITVASPLTITTNLSITGPGVTSSIRMHRNARFPGLHSDVTFSGLTISGGGAKQIFVIKGGVTAKISGLILTEGLATTTNQPGGAIYSEGNLTLTSDAFTDNGSQVDSPYVRVHHHASHPHHKQHRNHEKQRPDGLHPHICATGIYYGGAVYNHGNLVVTGSTFDSNVLQNTFGCGYGYGGAIYNDEYGTLTSSGNTYSHNSAYYGGAVYNDSTYGQSSFTNDKFIANTGCTTSTGCALTGCSGSGCTTYPYGDGGAIYDGAGPGISVTGSTFSNNAVGGPGTSSAGYAGAIDLESGSPTITSSTFTNNLAGGGTSNCSYGYGGAIYEDADNTLSLNNDIFTSNKAGGDDYGYGGAVYDDAEPVSGSGNTFTSNQAFGTGSACQADGEASGGAFYAYYGITMSGSTFKSNNASANYDAWGGAIYEDSSSLLNSDTFTSNLASASGTNGAGNSYSYGGAIYADETLRLNGNTFTSNQAVSKNTIGYESYGGAVYMDGTSYTFSTNGNTFTSNSASVPTGTGTTYVYGGAVYAYATTFVSNGDKFISNSASAKSNVYGGGLFIDSAFGLSNGTFTSNKVTATGGESFGGGIGIGSTGTVSNSTFTSNSSSSTGYSDAYDQGGGGVYDDGPATLNGVKISSNTVTGGSGGGIYVRNNTEYLNNSIVSGNSASVTGEYGGGGGIYNYLGMSITNTTISGNTAAINGNVAGGGGLYVDDTTTLTGSTVSGNKVTGSGTESGGGGIYDYYFDLSATNVTISKNTSTIDGGGFESNSQPNTFLSNVTLFQNSAAGNGGNIFNDNNSAPYVTLANTIVAGGSAASGKDVYNTGTLASNDYNILGTAATGGGTFTPMTHDKVANPQLLGLSNNGGPTFTNADQSTSPGKAYIPWTSASGGTCGNITDVGVDQRAFTRGAGGKCDVGAYELNGTPSAIRIHPHAVRSHKHSHHRHVHHIPAHERG